MATFGDLVEAQMAGATVRLALLLDLDFRSGMVHGRPGGFGDLDVDGTIYRGTGNVGSVSAGSAGPGQAIEELTLSLAGDETLLDHYSEDSLESAGRDMAAKFCFFADDWSVLDEPFDWFGGIMGPLIADRPPVAAGERPQRVLSIRCANAFLNRRKPAFGYWSHRDQTGRGDGTDRLFIRASQSASRTIAWPAA